jgi:MerR family mercuric resistance operon transcriptional regulator
MSEIKTERATATRSSGPVTIGGLARASEVGVETVRYYQRRRLLPVPSNAGGVRRYPLNLINRIRFIKKSQNLGFTLDEIRELLRLERGCKRKEIREKIHDLERMEKVLAQLVHDCEEANSLTPCPIIAALSDG